jgi:UDP-N-acetylmuramate--alanine ligase
LVYFQAGTIPVLKRSEVLGLISAEYRTIAIAGTHGKTSTSTLVACLLRGCGVESINFLGGISKDLESNYTYGESGWLVAEADEYDRSFLRLRPEIAVILSMDADHLDIYGTHQQMVAAYQAFTELITDNGMLILGAGLQQMFTSEWQSAMRQRNIRVVEFGDRESEIVVQDVKSEGFATKVEARIEEREVTWDWNIPGQYNASNASIGYFIARYLGCDSEQIRTVLHTYSGVKRRLELLFEDEVHVVIDDYAHHPEEIKAALTTIKGMFPNKKTTGIFQPHLYTRTRDHFEGFARELGRFDRIFILPIYPAREEAIEGITSEMIVNAIGSDHASAVNHQDLETLFLKEKHEVIVTVGAGNLERHHPMILDYVKNSKDE